MQDLVNSAEDLDANEMWRALEEVAVSKAKENLGVSKGRLNNGREAWFWKDELVKQAVKQKKDAFQKWTKCPPGLEAERQRLKEEYKQLKKTAAKMVAKAKAKAYESFYEDLESSESNGTIYKIAAQRRNNAKPISAPKYINDAQGHLLTSEQDIQGRWREYFNELLNEEFPRNMTPPPVQPDTNEITVEEVAEAVKLMKRGKAVGTDEIPAELWKSSGSVGHKLLCILFNKILKGDPMPDRFRESYLLPFFKKGDSRNCSNYRAIKLFPHTMGTGDE